MQIYSPQQQSEWDQFTIEQEPISSIDLMDRAAKVFFTWLKRRISRHATIGLVCGPGNNGGDGLAVARLLLDAHFQVKVWVLDFGQKSEDHRVQRNRLTGKITIQDIKKGDPFPKIDEVDVIIDAIFGNGLNRPVTGYLGKLIQHLNQHAEIYSIDIPSGLPSIPGEVEHVICAQSTLTFQSVKLSFLFPEYEEYVGNWEVESIGLHPAFEQENEGIAEFQLIEDIGPILKSRSNFSHKGEFGHGLLMAGSRGMVGASILAGKAALRSGLGLLSIQTPKIAWEIIQSCLPEAMVQIDLNEDTLSQLPDHLSRYDAIGIGPGLGTSAKVEQLLSELLDHWRGPMVIDADALKILAQQPPLLKKLPPECVLTPHPGEFDRLFGDHPSGYERLKTLEEQSDQLNCTIVLKGAYSMVSTPGKQLVINSTGNPGLSTGGSGDVLTGMILALLTQGYSAHHAARIAVFLHGLAADIALEESSYESIIASDIVSRIPHAFRRSYHSSQHS